MKGVGRAWTVVLLGGASGVGKTSVSYRLAHAFGVGLTEVDDIQIAVEAVTTALAQPVLHRWHTESERLLAAGDDAVLGHTLAYAGVLAPALERIIANHLTTDAPVILEGDFLLPSLARREVYAGEAARGRVRAAFVSEASEAQILENYRHREGSRQAERAHASAVFDRWLAAEAARLGLPVVPARPWESVLERLRAALSS